MSDWTNTGLIRYTGPNLTYENITICNGDILTDAIVKIKQIIDLIDTQLAIDVSIPGCLTIDTTSIKTIFQDIINYLETIACTLIDGLRTDVDQLITDLDALEVIVSNLPAQPIIFDVTGESITQVGDTYNFKGFTPIGGIISYAGDMSAFRPSGLGYDRMDGWAICNGENGTPDLCGRFIKYGCSCGTCFSEDGGRESFRLEPSDIPFIAFNEQTVEITGTTSFNSGHSHGFIGDSVVNSAPPNSPITANTSCIETHVDSATLKPSTTGMIEINGAHDHTINATAIISPGSIGQAVPNLISLDPLHKVLIPLMRIS